MKQLQVVVVTPERPVLETQAEMVVLPMFDGERGIQPGHAAFVGQLGQGEFRFTQQGTTQRLRIADGFVQVRSDTVTVLTIKVEAVAAAN